MESENNLTGDSRRLDVLVKENLFHNHPGITRIYDFKGSLWFRFISDTEGSAAEATPAAAVTDTVAAFVTTARVPVLLDQNFILQSLECPIYLRLHSKVFALAVEIPLLFSPSRVR